MIEVHHETENIASPITSLKKSTEFQFNDDTFKPVVQKSFNKPIVTSVKFAESKILADIRRRNLSHWPHLNPCRQSMEDAGWFSCNVGDRVICIYCDTICQGWSSSDYPMDVHAQLAPNCPFVLNRFSESNPPQIINSECGEAITICHPRMAEPMKRQSTFENIEWTTENSPAIDQLVEAGFFYSGSNGIVTCFYCNGSLHRWGPNDKPMVEHIRWFPDCKYAQHLAGPDRCRAISAAKTMQLKKTSKLSEIEISRHVAARLDLDETQKLREEFSLSIVKRCLEDQFRLKNDDFASTNDFSLACKILKKQIDIIQGRKDRVVVLSERSNITTKVKQNFGACVICLTNEKVLACMPCGHLSTCVPCGYAIRSCPMCRKEVNSFLRISN